jgi:hypothetical protein
LIAVLWWRHELPVSLLLGYFQWFLNLM